MTACGVLAVLLPSFLFVAGAPSAGAQEWHEAYRDGLKALAQNQPARAVGLLEYAVSQRPQPGRDVVTYGTNVERQYYPYLKLAEAYLRLHDLAGVRSALKRSETWAREPAEERRRLAAQLDALVAAAAKPAPAVASPAATAPPAAAPAQPPPSALPAPAVKPETAPATAGVHAEHPSEPRPAPSAPRREGATPNANAPVPGAIPTTAAPSMAVLEIVSQPPGASVYVDDELIGATDPEWGRLVRGGLPAGRHRVRLSLAGYADLTEEVDLAVAGRGELRRRLVPAIASPVDRRRLVFGGVAVLLLALTAWALRRPPAPAGASAPADGLEYFGDFRLVEPLGRGGMASVYRVERGGEVYALKRPLPAFLEEPEFLERFLREAEIGRALHHPNIVRILERGAVDGVPFFTMELVPGETLQALLQRGGALAPRLATQTIVQIAEALDYAHLKGVVHRDLKPSNVMVLADGTVKVMDYGIARARRFDGLTVTGAFLGSPEYVAPETIEAKGADARSDLYSLGVILYETLAGTRPFLADSPFAILQKHLTEVPAPPSTARPGVPAELDRIVLRLLSKAPELRYAAAEELVLDLRDFLNRAA